MINASVAVLLIGIVLVGGVLWSRRAAKPPATPHVRSAARRWLARAGAALCLPLSAFFYYAWYAFYLKWEFNELGRYYDPEDNVVYTTSGFVWVLPATLLLIAALVCAWRGWRR